MTFLTIFILLKTSSVRAESNYTASQMEKYVTDLIDNHLLGPSYNKNVRPNFGGPPVRISITTYVNDIASLSESSMVSWHCRLFIFASEFAIE